MHALVIVPTYNECDNIRRLVDEVLKVDQRVDMLIVDDNSPDGTGQIVDAIAAANPRVHALHRAGKLGLGTAYIAGFRWALERNYDRVVEMDADFSHRPVDLPRLLDAARTADVVIGSRNIPGGRVENWSIVRKLISRGGSLYTRAMLGVRIHDCTSGFKCFRREVLQSIDFSNVRSNGYGFQVEMNFLCHRAGFQIAEVPIVFPDRRVGKSKMSRRIVVEAATRVWELRQLPALPQQDIVVSAPAEQQPAMARSVDPVGAPHTSAPLSHAPAVHAQAPVYQHLGASNEAAAE